MKSLIAQWSKRRQEFQENRARRQQEAEKERDARERFETVHRLRLEKAAGVSSMEIVCHADTWQFIHRTVFPEIGYRIGFRDHVNPEEFPEQRIKRSGNAGMVIVPLSGPHLVRCMTIFRSILGLGPTSMDTNPQQYAMSNRLYDMLADVVDGIDVDAPTGRAIPQLVLDAGLEEPKPDDT